ncbi:MAG: DUF4920 domain-containing protein [Saprospirales bacterium]|nr:DUF4920 domain-containing protein [Saprospirales bacterium]MBK8924201.1 DUF4920 domain-containing protein [Saprospirales bacterium]
MVLKKLCLSFATATALVACSSNHNNSVNAQTTSDGKHFGATINADHAIGHDELISKMAGTDSLAIKVTGTVQEVCQKKGCWITLVSDKPGSQPMRVTFKDYAFFMPKDLAGKRVVIEGFAFVDVTSVDDLRHYAEDAGKSAGEIAAITEPKRELAFEAAGVLILD